jgi:nitroreductase
MDVETAMLTRRSVRAFKTDPVPKEVLTRIFSHAQQAPSWCNIQPWRVWVTRGAQTRALVDAMTARHAGTPYARLPDGPRSTPSPTASTAVSAAALYSAMGVARDDRAGRQEAWMRNFRAFDAPHLAMVAIDRRFNRYAMLDLGCWLQSVLLLSTEEGLSTCSQAALALYPDVCRSLLGVTDDVQILFGIGLGYEAPEVPANACRTTRDPLEKNLVFCE